DELPAKGCRPVIEIIVRHARSSFRLGECACEGNGGGPEAIPRPCAKGSPPPRPPYYGRARPDPKEPPSPCPPRLPGRPDPPRASSSRRRSVRMSPCRSKA